LTIHHDGKTVRDGFKSWHEFTNSEVIRNAPRRIVIESAPKDDEGCNVSA
jgi:hypothetical protein